MRSSSLVRPALDSSRCPSGSPLHSSSRLSSLTSFEDQIAEHAALQAALGDLSPKDVSCLLLMVVQGFTAAETAQILGDSPQAIAKRLSRAKRRLLDAYLAQEDTSQERLRR